MASITEFLQCPQCNAPALEEKDTGKVVVCGGCAAEFAFREGILDLNPAPTEEAQLEMSGHVSLEKEWTENLPDELAEHCTGQAGVEIMLAMPHLPNPDLAALPQFSRMSEMANDFFECVERLHLEGDEHIVEIGSHLGWASYQLSKSGATVIATDISHQLALTNVYEQEGFPFYRAYCDMMTLPMRAESMDIVFAVATIHHAGDLEQLFSACHRVLKPGGKCVFFAEPVAGVGDTEALKTFGAEEKEYGIQEHVYTIEEYFGAARKMGFTPEVLPFTDILKQPDRKHPFIR